MKTSLVAVGLVALFLLAGCEGEMPTTVPIDSEHMRNEPVVDVAGPNLLQEEIFEKEQLIYPTTVALIDPRTLEIVQSITPQLLGYGTEPELYEQAVKKIAQELARGTEGKPGYDQSMVLDKIGGNGEIIKGNAGLILKESELVSKIIAASKSGEDVFLPLYLLETNYKKEELQTMEEAVIASFTTYFSSSEIGRSQNIALSAETLDRIIVGEGDYFSFNTMVGERTAEKGYQPAPEIIQKQKVMGIGGGICQTSSTLFNAIDQLGVRITERHHHSLHVGYVPTGRDATVSYGLLDFKFQNSSGVPFIIRTFYRKNVLTIEIRTSHQYDEILKNL